MKSLRFLTVLAISFALAGSAAAQQTTPEKPTLVVLIAIDQLRPDYFDRFAKDMTGGLAWLLNEGAYFTESELDYATTETAPGHAGMLSGRFPRGHGIVRNSPGVADPGTRIVGDTSATGASPFRFRGSTLFDWMRLSDPRSRALGVSRKDRSAILPIGRSTEHVYWYTRGGFTTSTWYRDTLPTWVQRFNDRRLPQQTAGRVWDLLLPASAYSEPDSVPQENWGRDIVFPHRAPLDSTEAADSVVRYPWIDEITIALALEGVRELGLGAGPQTDLLTISLSGTDYIGHRYGPYSREAHDQVVRVDRALGMFLDSLFTLRERNRIIIALTADHGVRPTDAHTDARLLDERVDLRPLLSRYRRSLAEHGIERRAFVFNYGMVMADSLAFESAGVNRDSVVHAFLDEARQVPGVLRAYDMDQLARADTLTDIIARRWQHSLPLDFPVAAVIVVEPNRLWPTSDWANHGTPHDYDTRVPVLFWGAPFEPGRYDGRARAADIAPTLADVLGITPTEPLDGVPLRRALRR